MYEIKNIVRLTEITLKMKNKIFKRRKTFWFVTHFTFFKNHYFTDADKWIKYVDEYNTIYISFYPKQLCVLSHSQILIKYTTRYKKLIVYKENSFKFVCMNLDY